MTDNNFFTLSKLQDRRQTEDKSYLEFLRVPAMSAGIYVIKPGGNDSQNPHKQDELYYVVSGRARIRLGPDEISVSAGSVVFAQAGLEHCFYDIKEELTVLVVFSPAEASEQ